MEEDDTSWSSATSLLPRCTFSHTWSLSSTCMCDTHLLWFHPPKWITTCSLPRCFFFLRCYLSLIIHRFPAYLWLMNTYVPPRDCSDLGGFSCLYFTFAKENEGAGFPVLQLNPPGIHWRKAGGCGCLLRPGSVPSISFEKKWCREAEAGVLPSNLNFCLGHSYETIFLEKLLGWRIPLNSLFGNFTITNKPFCSCLNLSDLYHT